MIAVTFALLTVLALGCSSGRENPLLSADDLVTPTPLPSETVVPPTPTGEPIDIFGFEYNGTIRIAQWDDPALQMENFILGYILVHGMVFEAKLVHLSDGDYRTALESGSVDVVLRMSRTELPEWYERVISSGDVIDVGSLYGDDSELRIGVRSELKQTAPTVVDMLGALEADEEVMSSLAARITGGRTGLGPNVAGLIFFKDNEDVWTRWMSAETAAAVKSAVSGEKTSLHYKCLQVPGDGNTLYCK